MPNWLRKTLVILITVFTLGTVSPPPHLLAESDERSSTESTATVTNNDFVDISSSTNDSSESDLPNRTWQEVAATYEDPAELQDAFITYTLHQATEQTKEKFGERIEAKRGEEFRTVILPKIEETIIQLSNQLNVEEMRNLNISEQPSKGKSEKIFHISNAMTMKDVFRLHVRRENPPGQGHWFSFHYHEASDNFESHHELGSIYWDRNTPPNWMS
ncbi:YpjP family protein [Pseudalkalibacillus berkeleyi]|uniref:YpjP family protein n=1 Tax=Pseudalkalibacillus berkeleyi TaxID=1069813 RepID=A0ABS9GZS5_9BACL|nr:YpjP family protein [Pseudalkalibacillus berkeleyi]MCF6137326.1 YpjP family protein [Pseudalkalibacillus berkeleyi]